MIIQATNIPKNELDRHLLSLAHPRVRVLRKVPNTKTIEANHQFIYNDDYTSNRHRVKIPLLSVSSSTSGINDIKDGSINNGIPTNLLENRKMVVDSAIVRIMKAKKTISHNNLISEVIDIVAKNFATTPSYIKRRIEYLIENDYLSRDPNNRRIYNYQA